MSERNAKELETGRLRLTPLVADDVDPLHVLWTEPRVRRFLWDDRVISREDAAEVVAASLTSFDRRGFGFWVLREVASGEAIGFASLREFGETGEVELLYGLHPDRWGRGLATEAARTVLDFAFRVCGLDKVYAGADPPNADSLRVIERLGMCPDGPRSIEGVETLYYLIERPSELPAITPAPKLARSCARSPSR